MVMNSSTFDAVWIWLPFPWLTHSKYQPFLNMRQQSILSWTCDSVRIPDLENRARSCPPNFVHLFSIRAEKTLSKPCFFWCPKAYISAVLRLSEQAVGILPKWLMQDEADKFDSCVSFRQVNISCWSGLHCAGYQLPCTGVRQESSYIQQKSRLSQHLGSVHNSLSQPHWCSYRSSQTSCKKRHISIFRLNRQHHRERNI